MPVGVKAVDYIREAVQGNYDAVVATVGGDYNDIQAADDVLDAGPYSLFVRPGTYAGFTVSTPGVKIFLGPRVIITGAIVLSGDDIKLIVGPGCDLQGLVTQSGINVSVVCLNGVSLVGVVMSGNFGYLNGGGWDTLADGGITRHAIDITGDDCIIENLSAQTTPGGGTAFGAVNAIALRSTIKKIRVVDSDTGGIGVGMAGANVLGCVILGADADGILINGPQCRVIGNYVFEAGANGIGVAALGDNSVIKGNIVQDQGGNSVDIHADAEDCVVVANRLDGAVVDASGTSTVADNDTTAF